MKFGMSKIRNDSGMILVTVIIMTLLLMVIAIGVAAINVSRVQTGQSVIDDIRAEQVAKGLMFKYQMIQMNGYSDPANGTFDVGSKGFDFSYNNTGNAATSEYFDTNKIEINIIY